MRDLLNLAIVLGTPALILWLIFRPTKGAKVAQGKTVTGKRPRNKYFWWSLVNLVLAFLLIGELAVACLTDLLGLEALIVPLTLLTLVSVVLTGRQNWILWKQP
jgi:hypothetical protein